MEMNMKTMAAATMCEATTMQGVVDWTEKYNETFGAGLDSSEVALAMAELGKEPVGMTYSITAGEVHGSVKVTDDLEKIEAVVELRVPHTSGLDLRDLLARALSGVLHTTEIKQARKPERNRKHWSDKDMRILLAHMRSGKLDYPTLSLTLDRTIPSVRTMVSRINRGLVGLSGFSGDGNA